LHTPGVTVNDDNGAAHDHEFILQMNIPDPARYWGVLQSIRTQRDSPMIHFDGANETFALRMMKDALNKIPTMINDPKEGYAFALGYTEQALRDAVADYQDLCDEVAKLREVAKQK
jgi:hypothetical protein